MIVVLLCLLTSFTNAIYSDFVPNRIMEKDVTEYIYNLSLMQKTHNGGYIAFFVDNDTGYIADDLLNYLHRSIFTKVTVINVDNFDEKFTAKVNL